MDPARWLDENENRLELDGLAGAEQTVWGAYLLDGLRRCALDQAAALEAVEVELDHCESLAKYGPVFKACAAELRALAALETWDEMLAAVEGLSFKRLPPVKTCEDPELKARAQEIKKQAQDQVKNGGPSSTAPPKRCWPTWPRPPTPSGPSLP